MNPNKKIRIEKLTLNVGAGKDQPLLEKGVKLLKSIAGKDPIKTVTNKRIATWGIRPGLPIGCKLTLRNEEAKTLLIRLLKAKEGKLKSTQIDSSGNISFGIHEYIDVPDVKYDPDLGIMGFEVCVTFERPGYRIKKRHFLQKKIPARHKVTKEEVLDLLKKEFNVSFGEEAQ